VLRAHAGAEAVHARILLPHRKQKTRLGNTLIQHLKTKQKKKLVDRRNFPKILIEHFLLSGKISFENSIKLQQKIFSACH
jgi:hypothetical protein